jgi:hypothetical protein
LAGPFSRSDAACIIGSLSLAQRLQEATSNVIKHGIAGLGGVARRGVASVAGDELALKRAGRYGGSAPIAVLREEVARSLRWISDLLFVVTGDKGEGADHS